MKNNLRKIIAVSLVAISVATRSVSAQADTGLGIVLGQPTGISLRMDQSPTTAFDAALAWRLGDREYLFAHADYLWIRRGIVIPRSLSADLYYGIGGILALPEDDVAVALRLPIGVSKKFADPNLEVFAELAVAFTVVPATDFDIVGGVGLRFWF